MIDPTLKWNREFEKKTVPDDFCEVITVQMEITEDHGATTFYFDGEYVEWDDVPMVLFRIARRIHAENWEAENP